MKMDQMLKQAQKMQAEMTRIQEELARETVEGSAGGGMVRVSANGQGEILGITIEKDVIDPEDKEMLEDLVIAAIHDAVSKSKDLAQSRLGKLSQGLGIPGLM
ncbi:MAG: YbaB/EbfC family nucleoid-associated protein [Thermovirgaceae bacterium]